MKGLRVFISLLLLSGSAGVQAADKEATVQVTGVGTVECSPGQARLLLAVETAERTAAGATQKNAARMTRVIAALKKMGLPEKGIQTVSYALTPKYRQDSRPKGDPEPIGFTARNTVAVTVDPVERLGKVIDVATTAGANRVAGLTYQLHNPDDARRQALRKAVANARTQAEALVEAAGLELGPTLHMTTSGQVRPPEYGGTRAFLAGASTPTEVGAIRVTARVVISYRLDYP